MTEVTETTTHPRDFTLPEGCIVCGADLPIRVTEAGPRCVCPRCGWFGRPYIRQTHRGLTINLEGASA